MTWHGRKRIRVKKKAINMVMELTGIEDNPPLKLSNVPPNTAKLRIIKEVDLRISAELGNGAFGVVYRVQHQITRIFLYKFNSTIIVMKI